jgi:hypothetical protein
MTKEFYLSLLMEQRTQEFFRSLLEKGTAIPSDAGERVGGTKRARTTSRKIGASYSSSLVGSLTLVVELSWKRCLA